MLAIRGEQQAAAIQDTQYASVLNDKKANMNFNDDENIVK